MRQRLLPGLLLLFCLLTTACSVPFMQASQSLSSGTMIILKPTPGSSTPTDAQITNTISILSQRLSDFGLSNAQVSQVTANKQPAIQVKVPRFAGDESSTLNRLLATGRIEFWITGTNEVQINTTLDPTQYTQNNPGGQAAFTNQDLAASQCSVGTDGTEATFQNQS